MNMRRKVLVIFLMNMFIFQASAAHAFSQEEFMARMRQAVANAAESLRVLDVLFDKSRKAAQDAKAKREQARDLQRLSQQMMRDSRERMKMAQQISRDRFRLAEDARQSAMDRQKEQQRLLKDRMRDLRLR